MEKKTVSETTKVEEKVIGKDNMRPFGELTEIDKIEIAKTYFKIDPVSFIQGSLNLQMANIMAYPRPILNLPTDVAEMNDILTHQMMSTYRSDIKPLVVLSQKISI